MHLHCYAMSYKDAILSMQTDNKETTVMKTYRCPFCGDTRFIVQDVEEPDGRNADLATKVKVECEACHWVGTVGDLGGHH